METDEAFLDELFSSKGLRFKRESKSLSPKTIKPYIYTYKTRKFIYLLNHLNSKQQAHFHLENSYDSLMGKKARDLISNISVSGRLSDDVDLEVKSIESSELNMSCYDVILDFTITAQDLKTLYNQKYEIQFYFSKLERELAEQCRKVQALFNQEIDLFYDDKKKSPESDLTSSQTVWNDF